MAENLTDEIKQLNENATLLLQKYDGVFSKLSEESQKILTAMAGKSEDGLTAIQELLNTGNVAQAENALKLGGKSLTELDKGLVAYCRDEMKTKVVISSITPYDPNLRVSIIPTKLEQRIKISWNWSYYDETYQTAQSHYLYMSKDNGETWTQLTKWGNHIDHNNAEAKYRVCELKYSKLIKELTTTLTPLMFRVGCGIQNINSWDLNDSLGGDAGEDGQLTFLEAELIDDSILTGAINE